MELQENQEFYDKYELRTIYADEAEIAEAIERVSAKFEGEGRVLIRPSGTEPLVRVMIEGKDQAMIEKEAKELAELIQNVML